MYLVKNKIIPPKQFKHNPNIKDIDEQTVGDYLQYNHLPIPNEWYDDQYKQGNEYQPECINNAIYGIITEKPNNIDPSKQYGGYGWTGWTASMIYANQGIIPPKSWNHDPTIQNKYDYTVAMLLAENKIIDISEQWYHNPTIQNYDKETVAMLYAKQGIIPPKQWEHDPKMQDNNSFQYKTVALYLSSNGIVPPKQWRYDSFIVDSNEKTVQDYLIENKVNVPEEWKIVDRQIEMTDQIQQQLKEYCEKKFIKNQQVIINNPQYQKDKYEITFAVYLEINDIQVPKEFQYDPKCKLSSGITTAMLIALYGKIPSQYWYHDPLLKNKYGDTVAIYLSSKGIIPPKEWMHDIDIQNNNNESIKSNLYKYGYIYHNNQFIKLNKDNVRQFVQTETCNDICYRCLKQQQQEFMISNCSHKICLKCFIKIINNNEQKMFCPYCRLFNCFKLVEQKQQ